MKNTSILSSIVLSLLIGIGTTSYSQTQKETQTAKAQTTAEKVATKVTPEEKNNNLPISKVDFLKDLYENYIFGNKDYTEIIKNNTTDAMLQHLKSLYEYDCPDEDCYDLSIFRTGNMDCNNNAVDISKVEEIIPLEDDCYRVKYLDMGWKGSTLIKFVKRGDKMLIAKVIREDCNDFIDRASKNADGSDKKTIQIFDEPAYLMSEEEVKKELIGRFYCNYPRNGRWLNILDGQFAFETNLHGLKMKDGVFIKQACESYNTGNINGTVPIKAEFFQGEWYKQENSNTNMTIYFLVGYELKVELLMYSQAVFVGKQIAKVEKDYDKYVMIFTDEDRNWGFKFDKGRQFNIIKK